MIVFALCADSPGIGDARDTLFQVHSAHVVAVVDRLLLAAPIAPVDGLAPLATDGLTGSIFAIEVAEVAAAAALMRADPYTGTAWSDVELLVADGGSGRWVEASHVPEGGIVSGDGTYLLLSRDPCPTGMTGADILLAADVAPAEMVVGDQQSGWRGILLVEAPNLAAAAELGRELFGGRDVVTTMAIPVGMGRWPGTPQIASA